MEVKSCSDKFNQEERIDGTCTLIKIGGNFGKVFISDNIMNSSEILVFHQQNRCQVMCTKGIRGRLLIDTLN